MHNHDLNNSQKTALKDLRGRLTKLRLKLFGLIVVIALLISLFVTGLSVIAKMVFGSALYGNNITPSGAVAGAPDYPSEFEVRHVMLSWTHQFNIETPSNPNVGLIQENFLTFGRTFKLYDSNGALVAKAHQKFFSLGVHIDIVDADDRPIASLQEDILNSLFKVVTQYRILGSDGKTQIGESDKLGLWTTDIQIKDREGIPVMTLHRPFWNWPTDNWSVMVHSNEIDERIAPLIAAFKSAQDAERHSSSSSSSSKSK
jgi:uncharacterized protein YxjI